MVTGANRGMGFEICKQLASNGVVVVLTARDEKKGIEALDKFKGSALSEHVIFHQLDVADTSSVASLADFIRNQFGKLDILVCSLDHIALYFLTLHFYKECRKDHPIPPPPCHLLLILGLLR